MMESPGKVTYTSRSRFERVNIVVAILLAGWVPSILMLAVSYTILTRTLENKILRDRQTFVQLIAHLVGDDLAGKNNVIEYYQNQPNARGDSDRARSAGRRAAMGGSNLFFPSPH